MPILYYALSFVFAAVATICLSIVANYIEKLDPFKNLSFRGKISIFLFLFLVSSIVVYIVANMSSNIDSNLEARQTAIALTQDALATQQSEIRNQLTATAKVEEQGTPIYIVNATGTAIVKQLTALPVTQTEIARLTNNKVVAQVDPNLSAGSINVRSTPDIANNNVVGWILPGNIVIITGWTIRKGTWCRIDVPEKNNLHDVWVSYYIDLTHKTLISKDWDTLPLQLYFDYREP